ncbi:unnamed protein product [Parnassius apollo]|uniref:(apollo) hypothetical protein n=1 Tax=Parnassius apollo TaxID=110799 RepID=A0A8S3W8Z3_PARAO|nr:unnamed protein product [Parnassius apollo]
MFTKLLICFLVFKVVTAQINGEFWWLNDKLAKLNNVEPPRPKFDEVGEFDTDESAKVVFRDSLYNTEEENSFDITTVRTELREAIVYFRDNSKPTNPVNVSEELDINAAENNEINYVNKRKTKNYNEDILNFIFPSDKEILKDVTISNRTSTILTSENYTETNINKNETFNDKILFDTIKEVSLTENICTYMKKSECNRYNGLPYAPETSLNSKRYSRNSEKICCILPLTKQTSSKISFPDSSTYNYNRLKRSTNETDKISPALKQRNVLLQRKYGSQMRGTQRAISTTQKPLQKIVTPGDDYIDPYLNIKNSNLRPPDKQQDYQTGSSQQDNYNDYVEDYYAPELPKPGLVGLYSNHRPLYWTFVSANKWTPYDNVESGEEIDSIGYPAIDPRDGSSTTAPNFKRRLLKLNTNSKNMYKAKESKVSYHSNPDFQVLQRFKLPNLMTRNKPRPIHISSYTSTTESLAENSEADPNFESYIDNDYDDYIDNMQLAYRKCGRTREKNLENYNCGKALGDAARGSHPWLLLVVLTKMQKSILCYATLIHARAAVTAADCTYGLSPGDITIIAGVWDLKEDNQAQLQHRLASVHVHQQYLPGKLAYNIALLYWERPLRLGSGVLPACVTDANVKATCMFVGWGGYDQAIHQRPRWQRVSILSPRNCVERISIDHGYDFPIDAFCASVEFKTTVTGLGGPLMCTTGDVFSVVGVAVWRDDVVVLIKVREWVTKALLSFED